MHDEDVWLSSRMSTEVVILVRDRKDTQGSCYAGCARQQVRVPRALSSDGNRP